MGDKTAIEWTDATWNCLVGCSKVSPGCDECYAIGVVHRGMSEHHRGLTIRVRNGDRETTEWNGLIHRAPDKLFYKPLTWKRPRRIFVNSLSDLFHKEVDYRTLVEVFAIMSCSQRHTYQILTKRPQRMSEVLNSPYFAGDVSNATDEMMASRSNGDVAWMADGPLPNVHLGVSIENNKYAFRADHLRNTPAAVRWVSAEPLLGPLDELDLTNIDWCVVGGESGPGARPMHPDWARDLRDRCQPCPSCDDTGWVDDECWQSEYPELYARGKFERTERDGLIPCGACNFANWNVERDDFKPEPRPAFLFKQHGAWLGFDAASLAESYSLAAEKGVLHKEWRNEDGRFTGAAVKVGKKAAGRELDGRYWDEYPVVPG